MEDLDVLQRLFKTLVLNTTEMRFQVCCLREAL